MIVVKCDLCDQVRDCRTIEIGGKEYDVCSDCWNPIEQKLAGKGRKAKEEEVVLLPPARVASPHPEPRVPGRPPKIWGSMVF
jgi:ribosome-binding protein aMBF1 (putative translation factor)